MLNGEQWQRMLEAPSPRIRTSRIHTNPINSVNRLNVVNVVTFSCICVDWGMASWKGRLEHILLHRETFSLFFMEAFWKLRPQTAHLRPLSNSQRPGKSQDERRMFAHQARSTSWPVTVLQQGSFIIRFFWNRGFNPCITICQVAGKSLDHKPAGPSMVTF